MSPNGNPNVNNTNSFRMWLVGEMREMRTRMDGLPCVERGAQLVRLERDATRAEGQRSVLLKALPYVLAALGAGFGLKGLVPASPDAPATPRVTTAATN